MQNTSRTALLAGTLIALAAILADAHAGIYRHVNPDGSVEFSDIPADEHAKPVELPPINSIPAPPALRGGTTGNRAGSPGAGARTPAPVTEYSALSITQPADDQAFRNNAGDVTITVSLSPALQAGHQLLIQLDGKTISRGSKTSVNLKNVDRGTHRLQAWVVDDKGKELIRAKSTVFHLQRGPSLINRGQAQGGIPFAPRQPAQPVFRP